MPGPYDNEMIRQFMQEEEAKEAKKKSAEQENNYKKMKQMTEKAHSSAKVAFKQTQENRFEIEALKDSLKRTRITAIVAIVISIICMAMVMADELARMTALLP